MTIIHITSHQTFTFDPPMSHVLIEDICSSLVPSNPSGPSHFFKNIRTQRDAMGCKSHKDPTKPWSIRCQGISALDPQVFWMCFLGSWLRRDSHTHCCQPLNILADLGGKLPMIVNHSLSRKILSEIIYQIIALYYLHWELGVDRRYMKLYMW